MTITVAWVRENGGTRELLVASDSRLRSRGALDQAQKVFRFDRGDCCLGFCGDAQIAFPLFIQAASSLNNNLKTRTRALDVPQLGAYIKQILNRLVESWDLDREAKADELSGTKILFAGWSWVEQRFHLGFFAYIDGQFEWSLEKLKMNHPWHEKSRSLIFLGDYQSDYQHALDEILKTCHGPLDDRAQKQTVPFDYEPLEALETLLDRERQHGQHYRIGGSPQLLKVYPFGNSLPFAVRDKTNAISLFGRKFFDWEKTEYPVVDLSDGKARIIYPLAAVSAANELFFSAPQDAQEPEVQTGAGSTETEMTEA